MARSLNKLNDTKVRAKPKAAAGDGLRFGRNSDGGGLYLNVGPSGGKSWLFMWVVAGKRREMGLGAYPAVSLATARTMAAACREAVAAGRDPINERDREAEPTFADAAEKFIGSMEGGWRNEKHREQWRSTLKTYCETISEKRVSLVDTADVLAILTPIWSTVPETASRVRGRIERVLDFAKAKGWRSGENPALWRGHLKNVLPARQRLSRGHHAAMSYADVPGFMVRVRGAEAMAARALELAILTAARSGEVLGARWPEFDLEAAVWTIPAERMKAGREHRVPLPKQAVTMLQSLHEVRGSDDAYVFPGERKGRPLSGMAMAMLLRRLKVDVTAHGFRSSFRDWAGDATSFPREIAEAALAHAVGDATEAAYRRSDALARRRKLMEAWASYISAAPAQVIRFRKA
jgi:integrase